MSAYLMKAKVKEYNFFACFRNHLTIMVIINKFFFLVQSAIYMSIIASQPVAEEQREVRILRYFAF